MSFTSETHEEVATRLMNEAYKQTAMRGLSDIQVCRGVICIMIDELCRWNNKEITAYWREVEKYL